MLEEISYTPIFGLPVIIYIGLITIFFLILTGLLAVLFRKSKLKIPIQWHYRLAQFTIILALIHGILGLLAYV